MLLQLDSLDFHVLGHAVDFEMTNLFT